MSGNLEERAERYIEQHRRNRVLLAVIAVAACVVTLATVYMLTKPADTTDQVALCGIEEHQHTDACYETRLTCGYGDDATTPHVHADACYADETVLTCGYPDEATVPHAHGDACYADEQVLTCGLEEGEDGHEHTVDCYTTQSVLTCTIPEGSVEHEHTDACYTAEKVLTCAIPEGSVEHEHTDACYETVLTCELPEHTHTLACYADPAADIEEPDAWAASTAAAPLTGAWGADTVEVARTQLGYTESALNYQVADDGVTTKGYTRYGAWAGDPYGDWSASFVSFCLAYAGVPQTDVPRPTTVAEAPQAFATAGLWREPLAYTPVAGDIVMFDLDGDGACDHLAFVAQVDAEAGNLQCIVGDLDGGVRSATYAQTGAQVIAYAAMPTNPNLVDNPADSDEPADASESGDTDEPTDADGAADEPGDADPAEPNGSDDADVSDSPAGAADGDGADEPAADDADIDKLADADAEDDKPADSADDKADDKDAVADAADVLASNDAALLTLNGDESGISLLANDTYPEIKLGETIELDVVGTTVAKAIFVPEFTHSYVFRSTGTRATTGDTYGHLYNANGSQLTHDDDSGGDNQFKITYTMTAGTTYQLGARFYSSSSPGTIPITVELNENVHEYVDDGTGSFVCACGATTPVEGTCGDDLYWKLQDGVLTISGTGAMYDYSSSTAPWYQIRNHIDSIVIEDGATSVGNYAFNACTSVTSVDLPESLTKVGTYAFQGCSSLASIDLPAGITSIGTSTFSGCSSLSSISLPAGLTGIGNEAFYNCKALAAIDLPESLTSLGTSAFRGCTSLVSVDLPDSVTTIPSNLFYNCTSLVSVDLPAGLTSIGSNAFYNCKSLTSLVLPEGLTTVGTYAFQNCSSLASVSLPESLTAIGGYAFQNCSSLVSVSLPEGLITIGNYAFQYCAFGTVVVPDSVTSLGTGVFSDCANLTSAKLPASLTALPNYTFNNCSALKSIDLPGGLTSIGNYAFSDCTSLTSLDLPDGMTTIGNYAFSYCTSLTSLDLPEGITTIGSYAFQKCPFGAIDLPEGLTSIGSCAFLNCPDLASVRIPSTTQTIGTNAFSQCLSLKTIEWDAATDVALSSQGTVGDFTLVVGSDVDVFSADDYAVLAAAGCSGVLFEGPNYFTTSALSGGGTKAPLSMLPAGEYFADEQGALYRIDVENNTATLAYCPDGLTNLVVPGELPAYDETKGPVTVVGVDAYACNMAASLESVTFEVPENITTLTDFAFANARRLASINGANTEAGVLATMPNAQAGQQAFVNTLIGLSSTQLTGEAIQQVKNNAVLTISTDVSAKHTPQQADDGTFLYYTGESALTTITVSNPDGTEIPEGTVVRVYVAFDSADGKIDYAVGSHKIEVKGGNVYTMVVSETSVPGCFCIEIERPRQGDTISINIGGIYPSPTSAGGGATVWGGILTAEEVAALGNSLLPVESYQAIEWETQRDTFPVTKTKTSSTVSMTGDGKGGAYINGLTYSIAMKRDGATLEGVGKDYMTSADFEDVLTLPEGVSIAPDVAQAIQEGRVKISLPSGGVRFYMTDTETGTDKEILILSFSPSDSYVSGTGRLALDEQGNLVVRWRSANTDLSTEISNTTVTYSLKSNVLYVEEPIENHTYTIDNDVACTQHFMYSDDVLQEAERQVDVKTSSASITMTKSRSGDSAFGSPNTFTITAKNPGAVAYEGLASLSDPMPNFIYMRAEDIAAVFADDPDHQLTLTITGATLCAPGSGSRVTGIDGTTTATVDRQNESVGTGYAGMSSKDPDREANGVTLVFAWGDDGAINITRNGAVVATCEPSAESVQAALDGLGFVVVPSTMYTLEWDLRVDGQGITLPGGASVVKTVPCAYKDTFMMLSSDTRNQYRSSSVSGYNYAYAYNEKGTQIASGSAWNSIARDFYLSKSCLSDGEAVTPETQLEQGTVLDYELYVSHYSYSKAYYEALPLVDHMTGAQVLMAPVSLNEGAAWAAGCETVEVDGTAYYLLKDPGVYKGVWTARGQMADSVTVTETDSGRDTLIRWYFTDYTGGRADTVAYRAYVCPLDVVPGELSFVLNNETWLSDHESHRLYDSYGWEGSVIGFDKKIVSSVGDQGAGWEHSSVSEGEEVVYRLELRSGLDEEGNPATMIITGSQMYDALPKSIAAWPWGADNVQVDYADNYTVTNGDHWSVTAANANNQQYLEWDSDFSMTFTGTAYIYVTLNFPTGEAWQQYASKYASSELANTYYVLGGQASVTHELAVAGSVRLQKGVSYSGHGTTYSSSYGNGLYDSRFYYSNDDAVPRSCVEYYVTLCNDGITNLYLTDMQDVLPRGFTAHTTSGSTYTGTSAGTVYLSDGSAATRMYTSFTISSTLTEDGRRRLTIHFTGGGSSSSAIAYDEERGMCYLRPGEAIVFKYVCNTNGSAGSDDVATNTVVMPYYDFNGGGVTVAEDSRTVAPYTSTYAANDGGCSVWNEGQAQSAGFVGGTASTQWLESDVTVTRGAIKPGITKSLTSRTGQDGTVEYDPVTVRSTDTLNWTVTAENDGALPITDYVLTDTLPSPYMFIGSVGYKTYYGSAVGTPQESGRAYSQDGLFTIAWGDDADTLILTSSGGDSATLTIDGPAVELKKCEWYRIVQSSYQKFTVTVEVSLARDADGNATLSVRFPDGGMAIPDGGMGQLTLSSKSTTGTLVNKQYVNTCFITPLGQVWDGTTNKGNMTELDTPFADGALPTVRNSTPFTTAFGYTTSSEKSIEEVGDSSNSATSTSDVNYIVLSDDSKQFRYTATVNNTTQKAMSKLVIIDGLPEVGDHSSFSASDLRFSEFKVSLAENPGFTVTVTLADATVVTLDSSQYRLEFSTATEFSSADWDGAASDAWTTDVEGARSLRLVIEDASLIPANSHVSLAFTCVIDGEAEPGAIAWNSFGYHYGLEGVAAELEAAPLKVGVKVPSLPKIQKQLVDHAGQPRTVDQDTDFSFMVYEGAALSGTYATTEELVAALEANGRAYHTFTATVPAGASSSAATLMDADDWTWTKGAKYTVVELPCGDDYQLRRFMGATGASLTFTHDPTTDRTVVCQNYVQRWSVDLTKTDASGNPLAGAVFALYSPNAADKLAVVPDAYADLGISLELVDGAQTWYLAGVQTTGTGDPDAEGGTVAGAGTLSWDGLLREKYYLLEVKAPDGYNRPSTPGQVLEQKNETQGQLAVTVVNHLGPSLPQTGGPGTLPMTLGGAALLVAAALLLLARIKRGRGSRASG